MTPRALNTCHLIPSNTTFNMGLSPLHRSPLVGERCYRLAPAMACSTDSLDGSTAGVDPFTPESLLSKGRRILEFRPPKLVIGPGRSGTLPLDIVPSLLLSGYPLHFALVVDGTDKGTVKAFCGLSDNRRFSLRRIPSSIVAFRPSRAVSWLRVR
jgi:hypothetical protein